MTRLFLAFILFSFSVSLYSEVIIKLPYKVKGKVYISENGEWRYINEARRIKLMPGKSYKLVISSKSAKKIIYIPYVIKNKIFIINVKLYSGSRKILLSYVNQLYIPKLIENDAPYLIKGFIYKTFIPEPHS
jgi:hypothetical protein